MKDFIRTVNIPLQEYNELLEHKLPYTKETINGKKICTVDCNELEQMIALAEEQDEQTINNSYSVSTANHIEVRFINAKADDYNDPYFIVKHNDDGTTEKVYADA